MRYSANELFAATVVLVLALTATGVHAVWRATHPPGPPQTEPLRLDVNTASRDALTAIPGIGPKSAERIVRGRPWTSLEDLRVVLGERRYRLALPYLLLESPPQHVESPGLPGTLPAQPASKT